MSDVRKPRSRRASDLKGAGVQTKAPPTRSDPRAAKTKPMDHGAAGDGDKAKAELGKRDARKRPTMLMLLERAGFVSRGTRLIIERYMEQWGMSAFHAVLDTHLLTETELADALAGILRIDRIFNLRHRQIDEAAARCLGFHRARQWECLPIIHDFNNLDSVELVVADPTQEERISALRAELGVEVSLAVAERSAIVNAIDELFPLSVQLPALFGK